MRKEMVLQVVTMLWFLALALLVPPHTPTRPTVQPETTLFAPLPVGLAEAVLAKAERLYAVQVGYAGITPPEALAWRIIVRDPNGRAGFGGLLDVPKRSP